MITFFAQSQEIAPYSRFGLGQRTGSVFAPQKGMGGLGAAYRSPFHINFINPASYSEFTTHELIEKERNLTSIEAGVNFTTKNIEDGQSGNTYRAGDGFFDYFALGLPIGKRAGISLGLVPFSQMNYNLRQSAAGIVGGAQKSYEGTGRTYQLYAGLAYRFPRVDTLKNSVSVGMNFVYLFGNLNRRDILEFSEPDYYNVRITSAARLRNAALNFGVQYKRRFSNKLYAVVGAYSYFPVAVNSTQEETWARYVSLTSGTFVIDTVNNEDGALPNMKIPVETGVGISIGGIRRWQAGIEFKHKMWSKVEGFSPDVVMQDSWELRAGAEYRPSIMPNASLFKRMIYRVGGFYDSGYLNIDGTTISEYGATFGFALPIKVKRELFEPRLNFSFDVGSRGTTTNNLIQETFFRAYIGFTLSDRWFRRAKFD